MLKTFFCLLSVVLYSSLFAANSFEVENHPLVCAPQLKSCMSAIQKLPEARKLIATVQKEGPIRIIVNNNYLSNRFGAFWDVNNRTISVESPSRSSEGEIIGSILFELHNALVNSKINHYDYLASIGQIDRETYVRSIEYLEYENSKQASALTEKGIKMGIFPTSARLNTYNDFEEHYYYQRVGGHSAWIARTYDQLTQN